MPDGRRGEVVGDGRGRTRLNLEGLGEVISSFVIEGGEATADESVTSDSLFFPFACGTGSSVGNITDACTGSGNGT